MNRFLNLVAAAGLLSISAFLTSSAMATQTVELNSNKIVVNNAQGEEIILQRTSLTPEKVEIKLNPRVESREVCAAFGRQTYCGYSSFQCGYSPDIICGRRGCWTGVGFPRYCCRNESYCVRFENEPVTKYASIQLKFKDKLLQTGQVDEFQVTPLDQKRFELRVMKSGAPYQIKKNNDLNKFEFKQK